MANDPSRSATAVRLRPLRSGSRKATTNIQIEYARESRAHHGEDPASERFPDRQLDRAFLAGDLAASAERKPQGEKSHQDGDESLGPEAEAGQDVEGGCGTAAGALQV